MPTPGAFAITLGAALDAVLPGPRAVSDFRPELERLEVGESVWSLALGPAGIFGADSNVTYGIVQCRVSHRHRLADPLLERDWTEDELLAFLDTLTRPAWWRALVGVHDVETPPEYTTARVGPVIVATITTDVSLNP